MDIFLIIVFMSAFAFLGRFIAIKFNLNPILWFIICFIFTIYAIALEFIIILIMKLKNKKALKKINGSEKIVDAEFSVINNSDNNNSNINNQNQVVKKKSCLGSGCTIIGIIISLGFFIISIGIFQLFTGMHSIENGISGLLNPNNWINSFIYLIERIIALFN